VSTKKILVNGPLQPGDLVTQRVKEVGPSTDNGWFDGDLVSATREVEDDTPLDPAAVQAGDTVTLRIERRDDPVLTLSGETHNTGDGVYLGGWRLTGLPDYVTLTDHQPAPKPEWAPQFGHALVDGQSVHGFLANDGESFVFPLPDGGYHEVGVGAFTDFVPDEARPLPTRDQLADAMHDDHLPGGHPRLTYIQRLILADAALALLRGESR
jgi:hypothetical protein